MTNEQVPLRRTPGWKIVLTVAAVIGSIAAAGTWFVLVQQRREVPEAVPEATAEYGRRLFTETAWTVGADQPDPTRRYAGARLNCSSCHLDGGRQPGMLSLTETFPKYPRRSGTDGSVMTLTDSIDRCMEGSMNGRKLPRDGVEMQAMIAYIKAVNEQWVATSPGLRVVLEPPSLRAPRREPSPEAGEQVFEDRCRVCHRGDGQGQPTSRDPRRGYVFPPLWGDDSFNDGAGMARLLTAARFIKARMPYGRPDLTDDQAFDVAAFINSKPRPKMAK